MICTDVICLSSGLAKNNKVMSMFVVLFRTGGTKLTSILVKGDVYSQFFEGTTIEQRVFKKVRLF